MSVRPTYLPPGTGAAQAGTLILRDGSRHALWRVLPEDVNRIERFVEALSGDERAETTRSLGRDDDDFGGFVRDLQERGTGEAFLVEAGGGSDEVVAFGAYRVTGDGEAKMTLAVGSAYRRQGMGLLLVDRLARLAARRGVAELIGVAAAGNEPLVDLLRESGLEVEERGEGAAIEFRIDLSVLARGGPGVAGTGAVAAATMRPLFFPRAVAVAGASRDPASLGHRVFASLLRAGFDGTVYPVNPKAEHILSVRTWPSISSIPGPVDLVVVAVPAPVVPSIVAECAEAGVGALVVVSAGYAEVGPEGAAAQEALLESVRAAGMRMVGPNCMGLLHNAGGVRMNASFAPFMPPEGVIGFCSQSGALGVAIIALARRMELGLSSFVSVGNKADVAADDLLAYWEDDPSTRVLLFYLESFARPRRFARLARRVGRAKPIVVVKGGRSEAGGRAAGSHTAALTAADVAVDALFRQTGILRADTLSEMFGIARALTEQPLPPGRRFAIITNAGGPAILCADALEAEGLEVVPLSDPTRDRLSAFLPAAAATANPVDMIAAAGPEEYRRVIETVLAADEVDGLVVLYTPVGVSGAAEVERAIVEGGRAGRNGGGEGKPVYASVVGGEGERLRIVGEGPTASDASAAPGSAGAAPTAAEPPGSAGAAPTAANPPDTELVIPIFPFPEEIGRIAGKVARYRAWRDSDPGAFPEFADQDMDRARQICRDAISERGGGWLSISEARAVLEAGGLFVGSGGVAETPEAAAALAETIGFPVAAKLASTTIVHKTEFGGVALGLEDADAVRDAFEDMRRRLEAEGHGDAIEGVLIQPMFGGATEVMMGISQDPVFGSVLAFGLGGIHVEILRDVAFRVSPLTDRDAREMVREIRGHRLLQGYRGHPAADVDALEDALLRLSRLAESVEEIVEMDLNPVFAMEPGQGCRIADVRIRVKG